MNQSDKHFNFIINLPNSISIEYQDNKAKVTGDKNSIYNFISEIRKISKLDVGSLCKLDKLTLKVSDTITSDSEKPFWIEMPDHAWGIMASKFYDAWEGFDDNPLYFNDCAYLKPRNNYDLGIEMTDMPLRYEELINGEFVVRIIERNI